MIAALPMYDPPWAQDANDRLWQAVRAHLPPELRARAPVALTRDHDLWQVWQSPDLVLAQTCGLPFRARLHDQVTLVASPDHGLPGCPPGHYRSTLIRRQGDPRALPALVASVMAYNEPLSQSGWAAPVAHLATLGLAPGITMRTGAHIASIRAVAEGQADFAAVDAVTWAMVRQGLPDLAARIDPFDQTAPTPALPYITARGDHPVTHDTALATALAQGIAALAPADRATLHLAGITRLPVTAYTALPLPPAPKL